MSPRQLSRRAMLRLFSTTLAAAPFVTIDDTYDVEFIVTELQPKDYLWVRIVDEDGQTLNTLDIRHITTETEISYFAKKDQIVEVVTRRYNGIYVKPVKNI